MRYQKGRNPSDRAHVVRHAPALQGWNNDRKGFGFFAAPSAGKASMTAALSRRQRELLATAKGLAQGKKPHTIAKQCDIRTDAVLAHRRRLRHLRVTADEVTAIVNATGEHADDYLLALFTARRKDQRARTKAARKAKGGAA